MKELVGSEKLCYICGQRKNIFRQENDLHHIETYKKIMYVHMTCAFDAIMEDMRFRNLKEAWNSVFR